MSTTGLNLVPMVVEQTARGERAYDIYSRLLKDRVVDASSGGGLVTASSTCLNHLIQFVTA